MLQSMGMQPFAFAHVILPIGISFYTFESISYITDVYRGDVEATEHPVDFVTFIALFPHLIAGPVFRYKDLAGQRSEEHTSELQSLMRISYAVFCLKKKNQIRLNKKYKLTH